MPDLWSDQGMRVLELGEGISAPYAARLLADFGADVLKVEPPGRGDEARRAGPFPGDIPHPEKSGRFLYLNYGKRSITLDLHAPDARPLLLRLIEDADVVVENLGPGVLDALLDGARCPARLVSCSISPFGQDGPKAGYHGTEITAYAAGGMMYITGEGDREPVKHGLDQAAHLSGVSAASAILTAVMLARRTGQGQRIDISEQETVAQTIFPALNLYSHLGAVMKRAPSGGTNVLNSAPMPASDGWVMPSYAGIGQWWESFAGFVERPELLDERFLTPDGRREHGQEIDEQAGPVFAGRTKAQLFHGGQEWGLTMTAVQTSEDIANCPHLDERGFYVQTDHPVAGAFAMPGPIPLVRYADPQGGSPGDPQRSPRPAPLLGEHTEDVLAALGLDRAEMVRLRNTGVI